LIFLIEHKFFTRCDSRTNNQNLVGIFCTQLIIFLMINVELKMILFEVYELF